ncbi:MAG: FAD-dependent oxidoreductase, partial [Pseudobdellovibrionaceae bacterium]
MEKSSDTFIESLKSKNVEFIANTSLTNVGEFKRISLGTIRIREKSEVRVVIEAANKWKVKLHPYSKGHNWGYGSHLPHQNEMFLLDLSQLNQIVSIDEDHGVVALEPGVTQKMLADELIRRNSKYHLDVTGSSEDTSVIGNSLERGIAYCGLRVDKVCGLEVILGNGTQLRTGFGDTPNPVLKGLYPYGLGPSLDGLFFQSNFGVVVEAHIQLLRKPENLITISASVNNENLSEFVNRVSELLKAGSIRGIPHLANRERTHSTLIPLVMRAGNLSLKDSSAVLNRVLPTDWSMTASVSGSAAIAREKVKKIKKELSPFGRLYFNHREKSPLRQFIEVQLVSLFANQDQKIVLEAAKGLQGFHIGR